MPESKPEKNETVSGDKTAVVPATPVNGVIANTAPVGEVTRSFRDWLQQTAEETAESRTFDAYAAQLDRMLQETELDKILDADDQGTYETRDLIGLHIDLQPGMAVAQSAERFSAPLGVYVQFRAIARMDFKSQGISKGDLLLISSGAPLVIGKVRTLNAGEFLPLPLMIDGNETANGTVLKLRRIPGQEYSRGA